MNDPVLGLLEPHPALEGSLRADIPFKNGKLELLIEPDGDDLNRCLALARELVTSLKVLETKARAVAADSLLQNYNDNWREFQRARADGSIEDMSDPVLTADQFAQRLQLVGLGVTGSAMIEFCFGDDGLFAGHSIFVKSFDGTVFADTYATLFG